jgi:hypothetical protein
MAEILGNKSSSVGKTDNVWVTREIAPLARNH